MWETRKRFPWPRRLSAAVGAAPELRPKSVSKSLTRSVAAGDTLSVFIDAPAAILNFRLQDEYGRLLETIDFARTKDPDKPLVGALGVGI